MKQLKSWILLKGTTWPTLMFLALAVVTHNIHPCMFLRKLHFSENGHILTKIPEHCKILIIHELTPNLKEIQGGFFKNFHKKGKFRDSQKISINSEKVKQSYIFPTVRIQ